MALTQRGQKREGRMSERSIEALPTAQQVCLAYARAGREELLTLFALDSHCGHILRQAREPILAQMRLAWWRDAIAADPSARPKGDPLLGAIDAWQEESGSLIELVSAWEHLVGDMLDEDAISRFANSRAAGFSGFARLLGHASHEDQAALAGRRWALADLASHLGKPFERALALEVARRLPAHRLDLPKGLRALAVLDGLARRSLSQGGAPLLAGRCAALRALRLGLLGR
jgi:phytoene synthase